MKKIESQIWKKNYNVEPSKVQKAWIQRWLELLDRNSSIVIALPQISLKKLIYELLETDIKETRTLFFILSEIDNKINNYILFYDANFILNIEPFKSDLSELYEFSKTLFRAKGTQIKKDNWKGENESFKNKIKRFKENLDPSFLHHIFSDEIFLDWIFRKLQKLLSEGDDSTFEHIDYLTREILIYLLEKGIYSPSHFKNKCKQYFFEKNSLNFNERIEQFFKEFFVLPNHFILYFQIQKNKDLINIHTFKQIEILTDLLSEIDEIKELEKASIISYNMARELKYFLYHGEYPKDKTIIKIHIHKAVDDETALQIADEIVYKFLNVIKFEYSARNICVANKVLVRNTKNNTVVLLNRKTILNGKIHTVGNPARLKRIAGHVESARLLDLKEIALYWYKQALESESPETQFLNYWISLEQIFRKSTIDNKSSGDKLVETVGNKIQENSSMIEYLNLWGDIYRVGLFNPKRFQMDTTGRVLFDDRIINNSWHNNKIHIDSLDFKPNFILIEITPNEKKKIQISPFSIVFIEEGNMIRRKQWLSGRFLTSNVTDNHFMREAFRYDLPLLSNILYLLYYSFHIRNEIIELEKCKIIEKHLNLFENLYNAIKYFEELENGIGKRIDISSIKPMYVQFYGEYVILAEFRDAFIKKFDTIPDDFILEAYRNQIPTIAFSKKSLLHTDQALLELRFEEFKIDGSHIQYERNFFASLDRLRRIRNQLVHQAKTDININLFSDYLSKITRHYLKELFKNSTLTKLETDNDIIHK
ncbi:MAG: hypothetical protein SF052_16650 [Bacteroidia bacterium]|nr:hypothetical protein [Bacteroidia bacterium]